MVKLTCNRNDSYLENSQQFANFVCKTQTLFLNKSEVILTIIFCFFFSTRRPLSRSSFTANSIMKPNSKFQLGLYKSLLSRGTMRRDYLTQMNGVAIDWVTKNIYWTDGQYKVIGVTSSVADYLVWKAIADRNLSLPQDIAVNPVLR